MVDESQNAGGNSQTDGGAAPEKKDVVAYDSYDKAVREKKAMQSKLQDAQEKLTKYEQDLLAAEGKKDDVIKSLRDQLEQSNSKLKETTSTFAWNTVQGQIKTEAKANGCVNPDKLIRLLSPEKLKAIEVDDNYNVNGDDLKRIIEEAKAEHSDIGLFSQRKATVHDVPGNAVIDTKQVPMDKMTSEQIIAELKKLENK